MIGQTTLAKKGNNRLVDEWLKIWCVERCRVIAAVQMVTADGRIDLTPHGDVTTKHSVCAKLAKCAWQQHEEADDDSRDKTADDDESSRRWFGMAFIHGTSVQRPAS